MNGGKAVGIGALALKKICAINLKNSFFSLSPPPHAKTNKISNLPHSLLYKLQIMWKWLLSSSKTSWKCHLLQILYNVKDDQ